MTESDLIHSINSYSMADFLPLTEMKTVFDVSSANNNGYSIGYTVAKFHKKYPQIPADKVFFAKGINPTFYYDRDKLILFPIQLYGREELTGSGQLEVQVLKQVAMMEQRINNSDYRCLTQFVPSDRMRIELLALIAKEMSDRVDTLYELFVGAYQSSSFGFEMLSDEAIDNIFAAKTSKQKEKTMQKLAGLPDKITVYRGAGDKSTPLGQAFSWTLDINVANFFATRLSEKHAAIYTGTVKKADVLEYFDNNSEQEVLVRPEHITVIDSLDLGGTDRIKELIEANCDSFFEYKEMLVHNVEYHVPNEDEHGKQHALRVLFLAIAIAKEHCTPEECDKICTAAVWHDCGRGCPGEHGAAGAEFYRKNAWTVDDEVAFLIRWHSMDDGLCKKAANKLSISAAKKERLLNMLWVLKDADALDRVRFGFRNLDVTQLRFKTSKELTLVAALTLQGLLL